MKPYGKDEHIPFDYENCKCWECQRYRDKARSLADHRIRMEGTLGKNWENILGGLGDQ